MRVRIKYSKNGVMKFISHLDVMRYFQKALRRAGVDIAYSGGFSPHQIMSFAAPLGLGMCSNGEYMDIEVNSAEGGAAHMQERLNAVMAPGMEILSVKALPDSAGNAMASVKAARYSVAWQASGDPGFDLHSQAEALLSCDEIPFRKETKKGEKEMDLRSGIYELSVRNGRLEMLVDASSGGNIRPQMVLEALYRAAGAVFPQSPAAFAITREETYTAGGEDGQPFLPLDAAGEDF